MLLPGGMGSPRSQGRNAWRLSDQLAAAVFRLTRRLPLDADPRLREQLDDAAAAASRRISEAFMCDRPQDFARFIRLARASVDEVQEGIRLLLLKRMCAESDLRELREILSRLYPALSSSLVSQHSRTPREQPPRGPAASVRFDSIADDLRQDQ